MNSEELFKAITEIDDKYIDEANIEKIPVKRANIWKRAALIAASVVLAAGIAPVLYLIFIGGAGAGGGSEREPGTEYMYYAGPVFPMTAIGSTDGLSFERNINFDFSPYITRKESYEQPNGEVISYDSFSDDAIISDDYIVTNTTEEDITFTAVYPFVGNIYMDCSKVPEISVDGKSVDYDIKIGPNIDGFDTEITDFDSWQGYEALLDDEKYFEAAFDENPTMEQPVIIYKFSFDYNVPMEEFDKLENPDMIIDLSYDTAKTEVMHFGFNGMRKNSGGNMNLNTAVPKSYNPEYQDEQIYIIVMGEDIEINEIKAVAGLVEKADDEKPETDAVTIKTERYETTFQKFMLNMVDKIAYGRYEGWEDTETVRSLIDSEEYVGYIAEFMYPEGDISEEIIQRYDWGAVDQVISHAGTAWRVMYVTFDVTVPAGESIKIETNSLHEASYDYYGPKESLDLNGFDMVTKLGTNINFVKQSASVSNTEQIEIVYSNFGFDVKNGVISVILGDEEHYWMEIIKIYPEE